MFDCPFFPLIKNFIKKFFSRRRRRSLRHIFFTVWFSVVYVAAHFFTLCCSLFCLKPNFDTKRISTSIEIETLKKITSPFASVFVSLLMENSDQFFCSLHQNFKYENKLRCFFVSFRICFHWPGNARFFYILCFFEYLLKVSNFYARISTFLEANEK